MSQQQEWYDDDQANPHPADRAVEDDLPIPCM
jgi:hypothetical protein